MQNLDTAIHERASHVPWNKGKLLGAKPPLGRPALGTQTSINAWGGELFEPEAGRLACIPKLVVRRQNHQDLHCQSPLFEAYTSLLLR